MSTGDPREEVCEGCGMNHDAVVMTQFFTDADLLAAYERGMAEGITEGRRQATEGWEHAGYLALLQEHDGSWGNNWDGQVHADRAEAERAVAEANAANWPTVLAEVRRLVGPWEPAEQPEPARSTRNARGLIVGNGMRREPSRETVALYCDECGELRCEHRCPKHSRDLPCRTCAAEQPEDGAQ